MKINKPMRHMNQSCLRRVPRGFTLVELLTVIAVITILMTAGAIGLNALAGGKGTTNAVAQAEAVFNFARQVAVANNTRSRVLVPKSIGGDDRHPDALRRIIVAYQDPDSDTWQISDRGEFLPANVYFSQDYSLVDGSPITPINMTFPGRSAFDGRYFVYEFNSEGISANPGAGFVVGSGVWPPNETKPRVSRKGERDFGGFVVWRNGRTSLYRSPDQIFGSSAIIENF